MQKYAHNAVSSEAPSNFKGNFSVILNEKAVKIGKKLVSLQPIYENLQRRKCASLPPMNVDQDFDSIKFSSQVAVNLGIRDSVRHKSNFYKFFFDNLQNGFSRPRNDITFMQPVKKIIRDVPSPLKNLQYQKSIARILDSSANLTGPNDVDPGNKLLSAYESEMTACKSPASTKVHFLKQSRPDLTKAFSKISNILISSEIKEFEEKLPTPNRYKGNRWYLSQIKEFK